MTLATMPSSMTTPAIAWPTRCPRRRFCRRVRFHDGVGVVEALEAVEEDALAGARGVAAST